MVSTCAVSLLYSFARSLHFLHLSDYIEISLLLLFHFLINDKINNSPTFFICFEFLQEIIGLHHKYVSFITDAFNTHCIFSCMNRFFLCYVFFTKYLAASNESDTEGFYLQPIVWLLRSHYALWGDCRVTVRALWVAWLVFHTMAQELG